MDPIHLRVEGMAATGSMEAVENALRMVPGVLSVRHGTVGGDVIVEAADNVDADDLVAAMRKAGYIATLVG